MKSQILSWIHPLELAEKISGDFVLLYSGVRGANTGRYSYLAFNIKKQIKANDFTGFSKGLSNDKDKLENSWFGYLSYDLKNSLELLIKEEKNLLELPQLLMINFSNIYQFDHDTETLLLWGDGVVLGNNIASNYNAPQINPQIKNITSNMTRAEYLEKVETIIEKICAGELYQANLTRKFIGEFVDTPSNFQLFKKLCEVSPAAFSAFIKIGDTAILSSSPELFLNIDELGNVMTRPIKGTAPRGETPKEDKKRRENLQNSEKDRAENLMIVDLMRNDLAKTCDAGSVKVERLFEVTAHPTIHHLSSTVSGAKHKNKSALEVVVAAFPAGSMTGAPKIRAMNLCAELEGVERGVYSGAIGWFGGDGSCDLSVVIRTLIVQGNKFEFQVGGGIVADSNPESEFLETIEKARGICLALGVPPAALHNI